MNNNQHQAIAINQAKQIAIIESERAIAEVKGAMFLAREYPRNEPQARIHILETCERLSFAEQAQYSYPRGGNYITGPSIRLAELIAEKWENIDCGYKQYDNGDGTSQVIAYAWDLQTNVKITRVINVRHQRYTKDGIKELTDPRDIDEMCASRAARKIRACILAVTPIDIQEDAISVCRETLENEHDKNKLDAIDKLINAFMDIGVNLEEIESKIGHPIGEIDKKESCSLRAAYLSIKENMVSKEMVFGSPEDQLSLLQQKFKKDQSQTIQDGSNGKEVQHESQPKPKETPPQKPKASTSKPKQKFQPGEAEYQDLLNEAHRLLETAGDVGGNILDMMKIKNVDNLGVGQLKKLITQLKKELEPAEGGEVQGQQSNGLNLDME